MPRIDERRPDRISTYFYSEKGVLALVTVSGLVYNVGMAAGPWFEGQLAQCLYDIAGGHRTLRDMAVLALCYVAVTLLVQGMRYVKRFYVRRFANDTGRTMKRVLYRSLVHRSKAELAQESVGSLMTKAVADVDACAEGMRKFTTEVFDTGVVMLSYLGMLLYYDWRLTLLCCIFPPFAYLIAEKLKRVVYRYTTAYRESAGRLSGATLDRVSGALTYRVFGRDAQRDAAYEAHLADYEQRAARAAVWETAPQPLYQVISMAGAAFILWLGGKNVLGTGWAAWNIAAFTAFLSCFTKLAVKSSHAAKLFNAVQKAQISWRRLRPLLQAVPSEPPEPPAQAGVLRVEHLTFAYPGAAPVLQDVSFELHPGEILGVTGPVACGKSTLGRAFLCEQPYAGHIELDGRELAGLTQAQRAACVGYVGHAPELLSDTVEENIRLGENVDVTAALRAVCLDGEIARMPDGVRTRIGSGGVCLSGGQQARLALARAVCRPRPVLILDDPFASVDRATEERIFGQLRALTQNCAVILISHRLELFARADRVLWMENGKAVTGTHAELLARVPAYAQLYAAQAQGGDTDAQN